MREEKTVWDRLDELNGTKDLRFGDDHVAKPANKPVNKVPDQSYIASVIIVSILALIGFWFAFNITDISEYEHYVFKDSITGKEESTSKPGYHFKPFSEVKVYPKNVTSYYKVSVSAKDASLFHYEIMVRYRIKDESVLSINRRYGSAEEFDHGIRNAVTAIAKMSAYNYTTLGLLEDTHLFRKEIRKELSNPGLHQYYILKYVEIIDVVFKESATTFAMRENKRDAEMAVIKTKIELEQAKARVLVEKEKLRYNKMTKSQQKTYREAQIAQKEAVAKALSEIQFPKFTQQKDKP